MAIMANYSWISAFFFLHSFHVHVSHLTPLSNLHEDHVPRISTPNHRIFSKSIPWLEAGLFYHSAQSAPMGGGLR